ncbi:MAG: NUDIX domain-containing protein [bacterium]|nr:NUDIX domain-containing protein [Candidatus Sumerlaeota bacterium]
MCPKPYSLSVKLLIRDPQDRCLVLRRASTAKSNAGMWDFPGGKIDPGENLENAARRETFEETGLEIELARVAGADESESETHRIAYLFLEARISRGELRLSSEHDDFTWLPPSELAAADICPQFLAFAQRLSESHRLGKP